MQSCIAAELLNIVTQLLSLAHLWHLAQLAIHAQQQAVSLLFEQCVALYACFSGQKLSGVKLANNITSACGQIHTTLLYCSKTMMIGASLCVETDAKFGGPLHIEALPDQQQVVVLSSVIGAGLGCAVLCCAVPCCAVPCCAVLCCAVLHQESHSSFPCQVPFVTTGCVKLSFASQHSHPAANSEADRLSYKTQVLSSAQMTTRRYSQPWLQVSCCLPFYIACTDPQLYMLNGPYLLP